MVRDLYDSKNPENIKLANEMRAKVQYMMNVVDRSDGQIKVYNAPQSVFYDILGIFSYPEYFKTLVDPEEGVDIVLSKRVNPKNRRNVKYSVMPAGRNTPIGIEGWKEKCVDLNTLVKRYSYEELSAALSGVTLVKETEEAEAESESKSEKVENEIEEVGLIDKTVEAKVEAEEEEKQKEAEEKAESRAKPKCFGTFDGSSSCQICPVKDECKLKSQPKEMPKSTESTVDIKERIMRKLRDAQKKS